MKSPWCERKINHHLVSLINKHSQTRFSVSKLKASEILYEVLETQWHISWNLAEPQACFLEHINSEWNSLLPHYNNSLLFCAIEQSFKKKQLLDGCHSIFSHVGLRWSQHHIECWFLINSITEGFYFIELNIFPYPQNVFIVNKSRFLTR